MTEIVNHVADRSRWGRGPWDGELEDRVDFLHAGFACFIRRGPLGQWCGYVGVPREHSAYGLHYDDIDVEVHGGLTYADRCRGAICHVPQPGMPDDVWWLGFDMAHSGDLVPGMTERHNIVALGGGDTYRDRAYATNETRHLADQLEVYRAK